MLEVRHLHFRFGQRTILRDLNFDCKPGQLLHIKGPNGVGKTTLLSLLLGLRTPDQGSIRWSSSELRKGVCFAEANALWPTMDPLSSLIFWHRLTTGKTLEGRVIDECLESWQLPRADLLKRLPCSRCSTGMKRKFALIRLELLQPDFLLLDEPMLGLDHEATQRLSGMIEHHLQRGGSGIIISHDIEKLRVAPLQSLTLTRSLA